MLLTNETLLAPLLFKDTAPTNWLPLSVKAMALAPAFMFVVPPTISAPVWLIPAPTALRWVPMFEAEKSRACVLVSVAEVPLVKATAPVKLLLLPLVVKSIDVPAFKVVVPGTTTAPLWLRVPPAVSDKLPPLFKVKAGTSMLAAGFE